MKPDDIQTQGMKAGLYVPRISSYHTVLSHWIIDAGKVFTRPPTAVIQQTVRFNDISFYQREADFIVMQSAGSSGVVLRAGQRNYPDGCYNKCTRQAKADGMPTGSYWLYDSRARPRDQAKKWHDVIGNDPHPLKDWADYEENYFGKWRGWRNLYDFLEYSREEMPGREFGIYSGYYYWLANSPNPIFQKAQLNYFEQYPLWLAWYTKNPANVKIPRPWTTLWGWQYGFEDGIKYGVKSKEIDGDVYNGTQAQWDEMIGGKNGNL